MLANWVFISERTYSNFSGYTGAQAFWYSSKTTPRMPWMMRCSVAVKSRPSTRVWKRPSPPNMLSTTRKTRFGSNTIRPVPRSGLAWIRLRLVGTTRLRMNSLYFWTLIGPTETSVLRCM
jgi:hypothetical protein